MFWLEKSWHSSLLCPTLMEILDPFGMRVRARAVLARMQNHRIGAASIECIHFFKVSMTEAFNSCTHWRKSHQPYSSWGIAVNYRWVWAFEDRVIKRVTCDFRRSEISQRRSASPVPISLRKLLIDRRMRLSEVTEWVEPTGPEYHEGRKCARGYSGHNVKGEYY